MPPFPPCAAEGFAGADFNARLPGLFLQPFEQPRRIRCQEEIVVPLDRGGAQARPIHPHPPDLPDQALGRRPLVLRLLDQDARRVNVLPGFRLLFQHQHLQPASRDFPRASQPGKGAPDNYNVVIRQMTKRNGD